MNPALNIVGAGAVTAIGLGFTDTWAALGGGLKGFTESSFFFAEDDYVRIAEVPLERRAWEGYERQRLLSLAVHALRDILCYVGVPTRRCALILGLPEPERLDLGSRVIETVESRLGATFAPCSAVLPEGQASFLSALRLASRCLRARDVDMCLVGAADSYLNWRDLKELYETGRLMSADVAQGLIPGEAAVFIAVTSGGPEPAWGLLLGADTSEQLETALQRSIEDAGVVESQITRRISGLNGEYYEALESLVATARVYRTRRKVFPCMLPATSVGEIGAAGLALQVALASVAGVNELVACEGPCYGPGRSACIVLSARKGPPSRQAGTPAIAAITWQYAEDIGTLWQRRALACVRPDFYLDQLRQIDDRLEFLIEAAKNLGVQSAVIAEHSSQAADLFPGVVLSLLRRPDDISEEILASPEVLLSALHWLPWEISCKPVEQLKQRSPTIALAAAAAHRRAEIRDLETAFAGVDPSALVVACRAAGEMRLPQFRSALEQLGGSNTPEVRREAIRSAALLGSERISADLLWSIDISIAVALVPRADAIARLEEMEPRMGIEGARVLGDPVLIPWLLERTKTPSLARLAAHAYCSITGLSLDTAGLSVKPPSEPPIDDDNFDAIEDAVPWPDPNFLDAHWRAVNTAYLPGMRYWDGAPLDSSRMAALLRSGNQVRRRDVAVELAFRTRCSVFDVYAPFRRQEQALG